MNPIAFGRARAAQIWAQRQAQHDLSRSDMTDGERAYVDQLWRTMPGESCWMDAFFRILNGEAP